MNKQDQIQEMMDYGYSESEAAERLSVEKSFVTSATEGNPQYMATTGRDFVLSTVYSYPDKTMDQYELLHRYGAEMINSSMKIVGIRPFAAFAQVDIKTVYKLKVHFGYHKPIPHNALNRIAYFNDKQRENIKTRDKGLCVRCNHEATRFYKIDKRSKVEIDNCAMLCNYCTWYRMSKHTKKNKDVFKNMRHTKFKQWIKLNDPYKPISRKTTDG